MGLIISSPLTKKKKIKATSSIDKANRTNQTKSLNLSAQCSSSKLENLKNKNPSIQDDLYTLMDSPFLSTIIWATLNEEKEGKQARILKVRLFTLFLSILFFRRPLKSIIIIVFFGELLYEQENKRFGEAQQKKVRLISSFFPLQVRASKPANIYHFTRPRVSGRGLSVRLWGLISPTPLVVLLQR